MSRLHAQQQEVDSQAVNGAFMAMLPELRSRCARMARRYGKKRRAAAADDALASMYLNHAQAMRQGKRLRGSELGYFASLFLRCRSIETRSGYPSRRQRDFVRLHDDWHEDPAPALAKALTTSERDDPAEKARVALDWEAFANTQDARRQKIVFNLAVGDSKSTIAQKLGISPGRLTQLLDSVADEISAFFDGDVGVPGKARRATRCAVA